MLKRVLSAVLIMSVMFALPSWGASFRKMNDEQFWYLCHEGSEAEIIDAISKGANVHAAGALSDGLFLHEGVTPLMIVRTPGAVSALVKAGADVNAADSKGETPLMWIRNTEVTKALIKAGADVNRFGNGHTALIEAAKYYADPEMINVLVRAGADVDTRGAQEMELGRTALMCAAEKNIGNVGVVNALLKAGANVNLADEGNSETPLMIAASRNTFDVVNALLKAGADVQYQNNMGWTVLTTAAYNNSTDGPDIIRTLIKAGADVNARNRSGQTPLMFAARFNTNPAVINALIDGGAEDLTDKDGKTALVHAKEMGTPEIVDALIKAGAYIPDKYYRYRY